ncbi:MAG: CorA family divalent cation transporter [Verrucomicrobiota bacterium]
MKLHCSEILASGKLKPTDSDAALDRWRSGKGNFWFDIESYQRAELDSWLEPLALPEIMAQRCRSVGDSTQIIALPQALFLEVMAYSDPQDSALGNVGVICLKNLLITLNPKSVHAIVKSRDIADALQMKKGTTADLLVSMLLIKIDQATVSARTIRATLNDLDDRMDREPGSVALEEILDAKDAVSRLVAVAEEQEECFQVFAEARTEILDFSHLQGTLKLLTSVAGSVNRRADRLSTAVSDLRQRYELSLQDRTNHRLAILTVISAVFLPLTLIAGIWGMNFENMPELHLRHGYFFGLGTMVLIAALMTWLFYRRGWFD